MVQSATKDRRSKTGAARPEQCAGVRKSVYISNHQNILDFVTDPGMLRPRTVSLGKRDLLYVPFFGLLYWITGNIMINREDKSKHAIPSSKWRKRFIRDLSVWVYPEGTAWQRAWTTAFQNGRFPNGD